MAQGDRAGRDPKGHPRLYITRIRSSEIEEWTANAQSEGWTDLKARKFEGEPQPSASSESPGLPARYRWRSRRPRPGAASMRARSDGSQRDVKGPRRPQKRRGPSACRPPAHQASDRSTAGTGPALARSRVTPRDRRSWLPAARRQGRREEDEDEENREQEHRGGPRQDGGQAAWVGFHGSQTRRFDIVLRGS